MADEEPQTRGIILIGYRDAALHQWGDAGLAVLAAALPGDVRTATIDALVGAQEWLPTRHIMAWHDAAFAGPARANEVAYRAFVDQSVNLGFWRVQRLLLKIATPVMLIERASKLWRYHHTHGTLDVSKSEARAVTLTLRDHPFTTDALARLTIAEAFRSILSMARARNVHEVHAEGGDAQTLVTRIGWE
jgi:hypothetical protein